MVTAILILTYNNAVDTINCIRSIEQWNTAPVKFIVVDNGSSDKAVIDRLDLFFSESGHDYQRFGDTDSPQEELPYFTFVASHENDGFARGNNKGLRFAYGDPSIQNILILNNDILFCEDIIPTLIHFQQEKADCGLITPLILSRYGRIDHCCARKAPTNWEIILPFLLMRRNLFHILSNMDKHQKILLDHPELAEQEIFPVDVPSGACVMVDKTLFQSVGSFDPKTFLYYEENILFKKLNAVSRTNYCTPTVKCIHLGASSTLKLSSIFLKRCNLERAGYYLSQYGGMSSIQHVCWFVAKKMWTFKLKQS